MLSWGQQVRVSQAYTFAVKSIERFQKPVPRFQFNRMTFVRFVGIQA